MDTAQTPWLARLRWLGNTVVVLSHPYHAGLVMHSDDELSEMLGFAVVERETIHEWPLSWVQRLVLAGGTKLIYKSQLPPTVEPQFYAHASSPLLPEHRDLGKLGHCALMTIGWIDAPLLREVARPPSTELVVHGKRILTEIGEIRGDLPVWLDIGCIEAFSLAVERTLEKLAKLILEGQFQFNRSNLVERVRTWSRSTAVTTVINKQPRVIHGDLKANQVFVTTGGYRVIDWQRPVVGPPEVDLVALLVGEQMDPRKHVDAPVISVYWFLLLYWAVEAQADLFPDYRGPLFNQWSGRAIRHLLTR